MAFATADAATRAAVLSHFCRPDPAAFPNDPCVVRARAQAATAREWHPEVFNGSFSSSDMGSVEGAVISDDELAAAALAWRFNAYAHGASGAAMLPLAAKANHSCDPNTTFEKEEQDERLQDGTSATSASASVVRRARLVALRPIAAGEAPPWEIRVSSTGPTRHLPIWFIFSLLHHIMYNLYCGHSNQTK